MAIALFSNNAQTTLAGPISSGAVSANLAAGTGALFPNPGAGQYFVMTFTSQSNSNTKEIVQVTARSTDTVTIVRAQEGTSALAWSAGDLVDNYWTAGSAAAMVQVSQLQQQAGNYAVDSGSANAYVVATTPAPSSLSFVTGVPIRVLIAHTNTGASTLTWTPLASTVIKNTDGTALRAGQLPAGGIAEFIYDGTQYELTGPTVFTGRLIGAPRVFLASATYTPTVGTTQVMVEVQGGGAAGGGAIAAGNGSAAVGAPGGSGGYGRSWYTSGFSGAAIVVGAGGTANSGGDGNYGAASSFGATPTALVANGGPYGPDSVASVGSASSGNGQTASVTGANLFAAQGSAPGVSFGFTTGQVAFGANGGPSLFGTGGLGQQANLNGISAINYGSGGGGTVGTNNTLPLTGGAGAGGIVIVWEYS